MLRILDIGSGAESVAAVVFQDQEKEITRLDADELLKPDICHDITTPLPEELIEQFDIVYCSHVMEHIDRIKVLPTLLNISKALKDKGELWVIVPSMEWAAMEIIKHNDGFHIQAHIFGGQQNPWDYHRTGFTLGSLRQSMQIIGLVPRKAYQSPFQISVTHDGQGRLFDCLQNVVVAARVDGFFDEAKT